MKARSIVGSSAIAELSPVLDSDRFAALDI
jgi:hypothetical protein